MEDKKRILKMVEDGKITAEEAIKLLDVLDSDEKTKEVNNDDFFTIPKSDKTGKLLYMRIISSDGSKVKMNLPIDFIKIMGGSTAMYDEHLSKHNVDMNKIIEAIDSGFIGRIVEIESEEGDKVIIEIA